MKERWPNCPRTVLALWLVAGFLGCTKPPVIHGRVVDVFQKPIAGADVSIPKTTFRAVSGSDGRYTIGYAPGQFELSVRKPAYASTMIPLSVTQAADVPAADAVLYPIPPEPGIYYIGPDRLVPLPERKIQQNFKTLENNVSILREYAFPFSSDPTPSITFGTEARFLDTLPTSPTLYRGDPEFYQVEYLTGTTNPMSPRLNNEVNTRTTELGDEKLRLRTVKLKQSAVYYGWLAGPAEEAKSAYLFSVPSTEHAD
jgi:Carboxypeptidase regulatory-like domain